VTQYQVATAETTVFDVKTQDRLVGDVTTFNPRSVQQEPRASPTVIAG
jgi:hypothetical protein